jgi:hypothetical protein
MEANGDGHKPVYITEMGWTVRSVAHSAWQAVTPAQQAAYLLDAFEIAYAEWPWLALITVWNLGSETSPEWSGYNLLDAQGQIRPAYTALRKFLRSDAPGSERWMRWQQDKRSDPPQRYQVLAEDVTIHLGDAEMPLPWVALHKGINPSPRWEGVVYVVDPGDKPWQLTLRSMQSNYWSNRVWINDLPLEDPIPLADFTKSWVAHTWTVPAGMLRSGPNKIAVTVAHAVPLIQAHRFAYDEIQIKDIELWR